MGLVIHSGRDADGVPSTYSSPVDNQFIATVAYAMDRNPVLIGAMISALRLIQASGVHSDLVNLIFKAAPDRSLH